MCHSLCASMVSLVRLLHAMCQQWLLIELEYPDTEQELNIIQCFQTVLLF